MSQTKVQVKRPVLLAAMVGLALAAFAAAGFGVARLHEARTAPTGSMIVEAAADAVAEALHAAPWAASAASEAPAVWVVAPLRCADGCARFHAETVPALAGDGSPVRVLVYAASGEAGDLAAAALLAKARTWAAYRASLNGSAPVDAMPQEEAEGLALWARASAERLAEHGVPIDRPAVLWRVGARWRVLSGDDALDAPKARGAMGADLAALAG